MNKKEWHADIVITETLVKKCIEEQFPLFGSVTKIQLVGEGWDNRVFLINEKMIFRFPRRKVAVELLERENRVLNLLPALAEISIPRPQYVGKPTEDYPYPFQGYRLITGVAAYRAHLTTTQRAESIKALAKFLKQLHSIDEKKAVDLGVGNQFFDHMLINKTVETLRNRVERIHTAQIAPIDMRVFEEEISIAQQCHFSEKDRCLIHGDLDCRHLIFDHQQLSGIIDWGDMGISHKAADLEILWGFYPIESHIFFFEHYGSVDKDTLRYARFLGLYSAFTLMLYAADIQDSLLFDENKQAIQRINPGLFTA